MYESGALSLENVAIANKPHALEIIQNLISSGLNPLVPNSKKLFPYHFAQSLEIFEALTPPPIQRESYLLTLARSTAKEDEKIEILRNAVNIVIIPLDLVFSGEDNLTCLGIAAQKRECRFAQELGYVLQASLELKRILLEKELHINELQERLKKEETPQNNFTKYQNFKILEKEARLSEEYEKFKLKHKEEIEKYKIEVDHLKKEAHGNVALENVEIQRKLEIAVEQIAVERKTIENYKIEVDHLKKEAAGNVALENGEIQRRLEIAVERIGNLTFENDLLKKDSSNKEELLKAEILNLNKCISRKKEKCADLSAKNESLKKESDRISNEASEIKKENENLKFLVVKEEDNFKCRMQKVQFEASEIKKENENLKSLARKEEDKFKCRMQKVQFECFETINKLQNENEELQKQLKGVQTFKKQAQENIRQLNELFDVENNSHSEMHVKELEDQIVALKTVNSDLESISKKFEQVTSCSLCDEKYESSGERAPVKLKCSHVFCSKCSYNWLKSQGSKSSCPSCRTPYRSEDIRFVNLNADL